ncbi:MAG: transcriptional repressor [Clostridiales bacterium]
MELKKTRNTVQRKLILDEVKGRCDHPTADDVYSAVHQIDSHISRATVYRNLNLLANQGEIRHVPPLDGAECFDYRLEHHYHFQCKCCGVVKDVDIDYMGNLDHNLNSKEPYIIEEHQLMFQGICDLCSNKIE